MHISTKTGYALRALAELADDEKKQPVSIAHICKKQNLPAKYIEQLFRKLKKNGIITSVHGSRGGYLLNRKATEISLKDIMQAVDENMNYTYCDNDQDPLAYCQGNNCGFRKIWDEIQTHLDDYFSSIKLDKILDKIKE
ncbi:MAG TPA: Rrf2 family transcriptional regulator [Candidatus Cloacimonas sp.]|jgi:Rrf2 family iron-sulfur cluster assembly transcriptional regulator|nr:Rrf2 family transcriptional regulator, iron-sulfur cluster assembly transcription factor [Candidatus Cloacimonadota bacterium]HCX73624.1 Rrf2 family transcriptional regulator [Candidatus Cloacimonas sp.]